MPARHKQIAFASLLLLLLSLFYIHPVYDPDFWWHLRSGQSIWENRAVPAQDHFSFTTYEGTVSPEQHQRIHYILTQYWLSQPAMYLIWKWSGPAGIILLRALILLIAIGTAFRFMRRRGTDYTIALSLSALAGVHLAIFTGERPQLFSFLFSVLYLYGIDLLRTGQEGDKKIRALFILLPALTLVWANIHASALVAWLIGTPYIVETSIKYAKYPDRRTETGPAILTMGASLCAALINPNTYHGLVLTFDLMQSKHLQLNTEFMSPFSQMQEMRLVYPAYLILIVLSLVLLCLRRAPLVWKFVIAIFLAMSMSAMRFTPFFVLLAPMLLGPLLQQGIARHRPLAHAVIGALALLSCLFQVYQNHDEFFTFGINQKDLPRAAVGFAKENGIRGRMFNYFEWGGYMLWHLPEEKTFIDGRALRLDVFEDYDRIISPSPGQTVWKQLLERYRIDHIVIPGAKTDLTYLLLSDRDWRPVYSDEIAVIFVREPALLPAIPGATVMQDIIAALNAQVREDPENIVSLKRLAGAHYRNKDPRNALMYYRKALALQPADPFLQQMTNLLQLKQ